MRDPVAGVYFVISAPGPGPASVPFGLVLAFVLLCKSNEKWCWEIVDYPWWFLDVFWCVLISFPLIFEGFGDFAGFLGPSRPPVRVLPLAFAFPMFCEGFKETPPNLPISL